MDYYPPDSNPLLRYQMKQLEKRVRAIERRHKHMVQALMKKVIPKEEWEEWLAEYMGDMEE